MVRATLNYEQWLRMAGNPSIDDWDRIPTLPAVLGDVGPEGPEQFEDLFLVSGFTLLIEREEQRVHLCPHS